MKKQELLKALVFISVGGCAAKAIRIAKRYKQQKNADAQITELDNENE